MLQYQTHLIQVWLQDFHSSTVVVGRGIAIQIQSHELDLQNPCYSPAFNVDFVFTYVSGTNA